MQSVILKQGIVTDYNYLYNQYKFGNYQVVEGKIENFEVHYKEKDGKDYRCVRFEINGVAFDLTKEYDAGYNMTNEKYCLIKQNGQKLKITYLVMEDLEKQYRNDHDHYITYDHYGKEVTSLSTFFNEETGNTIAKIEEYK